VKVTGFDDHGDRILVQADRASEQLDVSGDVIGVLAEVGMTLGEGGVQDGGDQFRGAGLGAGLLAVHPLVGQAQAWSASVASRGISTAPPAASIVNAPPDSVSAARAAAKSACGSATGAVMITQNSSPPSL